MGVVSKKDLGRVREMVEKRGGTYIGARRVLCIAFCMSFLLERVPAMVRL